MDGRNRVTNSSKKWRHVSVVQPPNPAFTTFIGWKSSASRLQYVTRDEPMNTIFPLPGPPTGATNWPHSPLPSGSLRTSIFICPTFSICL